MIAIEGRFGYALTKALDSTRETTSVMANGLFQILRGNTLEVAGPVGLYRAAAGAGNEGWSSFLLMMAIISVNLGLINLLPIPMLDGGHLLVFSIEAARRKPLSETARERIQLVGLIVIGLIMILALLNDVTRLFPK